MRRHTILTLAAATIASLPCAISAQSLRGGTGFLFQQPRVNLTLRAGWAGASAHSDLFAFATEQLTLDRGDFSSLSFDTEIAVRVLPRTSVVFSLGVAGTTRKSEFRDWFDNNELPIEQTTSFKRVPVTVGIRQYLMPVGRSVGRLAWVPSRFAPYVGAGGGALYYRFHQEGDFIDFQSEALDVFPGQLSSKGWTGTVHALAGIDYSLGSRLALTAEARYLWSSATLSRDFSGFQPIDLSGLATTAGFTVRF